MGSFSRQRNYCINNEEDKELEDTLISFPELKNGVIGLYDITALQVAAAFTRKGITPKIKELLSQGKPDQFTDTARAADKGDQLGRTPLHYAALNGNSQLVAYLLNLGVNIECKFQFIKSPLRYSNENYDKWNRLFIKLPPPDGWGRTPLHVAAKEGHIEIVRLLLEVNANPNARDEKGVTPLLLSGCNQNKGDYEEIVQLLVSHGADVNVKSDITGTTALYHAVALKSTKATEILIKAGAWLSQGPCKQTELHEAAANGLSEILQMFLGDPRITPVDINRSDVCHRTPLYRAASGGHKECLRLLINRGGNLAHVTSAKETVMDAIFGRISRPSQFIRDLLDERITGNDMGPNDQNFRVTLDFSILTPKGYDNQTDVIYHILVTATEKQKVEILQHPLIECFLRLKWARIRLFFFLLIYIYIAFVLSLSTYVMLLIHTPDISEVITTAARYFVIVTSAGLSGHAFIQLILVQRNFINQYELWMNLTCTILSLVVAIYGIDLDRTSKIATPSWSLHVASIAVLLAWAELMLLIGRFPTYGYYALMFAAVLQNVIKVLLTFVCLVFGFALSYSIQFYNYEQFQDPWCAIVKTTVMMMGEFDYGDLFGNAQEAPARLPITSRVIFLFFIILASIVLMNLMVGLAVSDIQGLRQGGLAKRFEKQAEFLRQLEKVISFPAIDAIWFPRFLRNCLKTKRCIPLQLVVQPEHIGAGSADAKKVKKLPCELIESIVAIAQNKYKEKEDIFKNPQMPHLIETLRNIIHMYETRTPM